MMPGGGVDLAIADQGYDTFKLLEQLNIPYDEPPENHHGKKMGKSCIVYLVGGLEHFSFFHMLGIIIPTD